MRRQYSWFPACCFWVLLFAAGGAYLPGLKGGFLFDDVPNLEHLGLYGGVVDWESFKSFVFGGIAGPTGRPLSLLTFLFDSNTWPSDPERFKVTNLQFHLLTGAVLCWATLLLMRLFGRSERQAEWIVIINMGLWLLHPYFVSTTLYIVQRMTQLSALFVLAGLAGYLHGRLLLSDRPRAGYIWMSVSVVSGTLLAVLSKENGVLLPLLICVVEFCLPLSDSRNRPDRRWSLLFLWLPSLAVIGLLARYIDFSSDVWPMRPFNQPERLMSETRILWEYLYHLWVPRIEGHGLFQDGYVISRGWFSPLSTLFATIGLTALIGSAIALRRRWPLFSFAVLFFFAAHLIESTVVGLELYFEHRNYVAAAFLFLPLAAGLVNLQKFISRFINICVVILLFALLAGLTLQRSILWGDTGNLERYWAMSSPNSPRAQYFLANDLFSQGRIQDASRLLEDAGERLPESSLLTMQWLMQHIAVNTATHKDFLRTAQKLKMQRFDAQTIMALRVTTEALSKPGEGLPQYRQWLLDLIIFLDGLEQYQRVSAFTKVSPYLKGLLYLAQGQPEQTMPLFLAALDYQQDTDAGLSMVAELGRAGYPAEAYALLKMTEAVYQKQPHRTLKRPREVYDDEIDRMNGILREDMLKNSTD